MNSVKLNNVSLNYQRPTSSRCKDIGIRKFEFVAKTQFLRGFKTVRSQIKNTKISPSRMIAKLWNYGTVELWNCGTVEL